MRALVGIVRRDDPNVDLIVGVRVRRAVAAKGKRLAIRRPCGLAVIEIPGSDLRGSFYRNVEDIKMGAAAVEVANGVALELQPINDKRTRSLRLGRCGRSRLFLVFCRFEILGLRVAKNQYEPSAVWRPLEVVHALSDVGQANGFAAAAVEQPHLVFAAVARREKR